MNKTTTELTDLLRQLSTIAPKECRYTDDGEWQILDTETGYWLHLYDANEIDPFRVAGLVQRRIEARGWRWLLASEEKAQEYTGVVFYPWLDRRREASTPAAALLTAYLAALEVLR